MIIFLDHDLKSSLEGGGPRSGGGCALIRKLEMQEITSEKSLFQHKSTLPSQKERASSVKQHD